MRFGFKRIKEIFILHAKLIVAMPSGSTHSTSGKELIQYGKQEINGLLVRPDSRSVIRKAIEGHPIAVDSNNDYINLYHVFERYAQAEGLTGLRLIRQQVGSTRWIVQVVKDEADVPAPQLEKGYDPKRGRYKRYAELLAQGDALTFADKSEAIKARRAWQLYVPAEKRRHQRSTVKAMKKSGKYLVAIIPK